MCLAETGHQQVSALDLQQSCNDPYMCSCSAAQQPRPPLCGMCDMAADMHGVAVDLALPYFALSTDSNTTLVGLQPHLGLIMMHL